MELTTEKLPNGVEKIALAGRMDTAGAQEIDMRFIGLTTTRPALIVVDLSQVSFLASMGLRTLVSAARALMRRGGRMALANPQPLVAEALQIASIDSLLPVYADIPSACEGLTAATGTHDRMPTGSDGLLVSNDLSELRRIAAWIDEWGGRQRLPAQTTERLQLCSTEAVTNVIVHAYNDCASHEIALTLERRPDGVAFEIVDDGRAFDPRQWPEPPRAQDLETAAIGGWGIAIMRRVSDQIHYRRADTRNILTLFFRWPPPG